jgi:hypothetical protein
MPTTPKGLPYPDPTSHVSLGAADIRALAEGIDVWALAHGPTAGEWLFQGNLTQITTNASGDAPILFPVIFTSIRSVVAWNGADAISPGTTIACRSYDNNGFTIRAYQPSGAVAPGGWNVGVMWLAFGAAAI